MSKKAQPVPQNKANPAAESENSPQTSNLLRSPNRWTFLTNHSHVLILLHRNPSMVLREVALQIGITERAVQRIIADLEDEGFIKREKVGRQNHYEIYDSKHLRHAIEEHCTIGKLLALIDGD